ncbi:unnamed protein product, partial [Brenthis ino]
MFNKRQISFKLLGRNEGKIKSYKSCFDVRAWSHDTHVRDRYLRDWIKSDMPICVVPVCTVAGMLRNMSWRHRKKITPRCQPECKSKVVLESICNSCHAIKECLKNEQAFDKYFVEEEFETTHWPCERCLEALKAIKMFWKIILEKIFRIDTKSELNGPCTSNESVKAVAHIWQSEIIERALIVKTLSPFLCDRPSNFTWYRETSEINVSQNITSRKDMGTEMDILLCNTIQNKRSSHKPLSRCTSAVVKTVDFSCNTCLSNEKLDDRKKVEYMKQRCNLQNDELRILKRENMAMKLELETMSKNMPSYTPLNISDSNNVVAPLPYESCCESDNVVKDIDSEMIITLKNCKNTVLHKTNTMANESFCGSCCKKNEDPNKILSKVHNAFKEMIDREQKFASKRKLYRKDKNINASYHDVNTKKSHQSNPYSAKSSHSSISDSIFVSTTEVL